jgi:hypothetical protein
MKSKGRKATNGIAYMYAIYNPDTDMYWSERYQDLVDLGKDVTFYDSEPEAIASMEDSWVDFDLSTSIIRERLAWRRLEAEHQKPAILLDITKEEFNKAKIDVGKLEIVMVKAISLGHPYG